MKIKTSGKTIERKRDESQMDRKVVENLIFLIASWFFQNSGYETYFTSCKVEMVATNETSCVTSA